MRKRFLFHNSIGRAKKNTFFRALCTLIIIIYNALFGQVMQLNKKSGGGKKLKVPFKKKKSEICDCNDTDPD
jgi:hypothetical protein